MFIMVLGFLSFVYGSYVSKQSDGSALIFILGGFGAFILGTILASVSPRRV